MVAHIRLDVCVDHDASTLIASGHADAGMRHLSAT